LELDALDHLGTIESPVAEQQVISFQRPQSNRGSIEEDNDQHKVVNDRGINIRQIEDIMDHRVMDCDEVRIMIKVLGTKVHVD